MIKLNDNVEENSDKSSEKRCLEMCRSYGNATGIELILYHDKLKPP